MRTPSGHRGRRLGVTNQVKKIVAASQRWCCARCKELLSRTFEVDHKCALYRGGANDPENLQALCAGCHREKTVEEHLQSMREEQRRAQEARWKAEVGVFFQAGNGTVPLPAVARLLRWNEGEAAERLRALNLPVVPRCAFPVALWGALWSACGAEPPADGRPLLRRGAGARAEARRRAAEEGASSEVRAHKA